MAVQCPTHRLLFLQNPRTGCSAVGRHLVEFYGGVPTPPDASRPRGYHKHASLAEVVAAGVLSSAERSAWLVFAGVRNPYDSVASLYQKRRNWAEIPRERRTHRKWWQKPRTRRQVEFAANHGFEEFVVEFIDSDERPRLSRLAQGVDRVVRFERLNEELAEVLTAAGVADPKPVPHHNPTAGKGRYQGYFTPRAREIVERVYGTELERYGYDFDGVVG